MQQGHQEDVEVDDDVGEVLEAAVCEVTVEHADGDRVHHEGHEEERGGEDELLRERRLAEMPYVREKICQVEDEVDCQDHGCREDSGVRVNRVVFVMLYLEARVYVELQVKSNVEVGQAESHEEDQQFKTACDAF